MASLLHGTAPVAAAPSHRSFPDLGNMSLIELTVGVLDRYVKRLAVDHPSRSRRGNVGLPLAAQQMVPGLVVARGFY